MFFSKRSKSGLEDLGAAACDAARLVRDGTVGRAEAVDVLYRTLLARADEVIE